jgi:hypothetical protein
LCRSIKKKLNFEVEIVDIDNTEIQDNETDDLSFLYAYADLKKNFLKNPIDYLNLHKKQMEIGKIGEVYVYEHECKNLRETPYINKVDDTIAGNPANGYDILSFTRDGKPLHIEVKATSGSEDVFYLSRHEWNTAERMKKEGSTYVVYFVKEILSENPTLIKIKDITSNPKYNFEESGYKVTKA